MFFTRYREDLQNFWLKNLPFHQFCALELIGLLICDVKLEGHTACAMENEGNLYQTFEVKIVVFLGNVSSYAIAITAGTFKGCALSFRIFSES
jgi:hypothetical protein